MNKENLSQPEIEKDSEDECSGTTVEESVCEEDGSGEESDGNGLKKFIHTFFVQDKKRKCDNSENQAASTSRVKKERLSEPEIVGTSDGEPDCESMNASSDSDVDNSKSDEEANESSTVEFDEEKKYTVKIDRKSAFNESTISYRLFIEPSDGAILDAKTFFKCSQSLMLKKIERAFRRLERIKVVLYLQCSYVDNEYNDFGIAESVNMDSVSNYKSYFKSAREKIISEFDILDTENKGCKQLHYLDLHIHEMLTANSSYVALPRHISRRDVVNVGSADHLSFKWAVLAALHPEIYNPSDYVLSKFSKEFNLEGIEHPVKLNDIPKVEKLNNDISFNVFILKWKRNADGTFKQVTEGPVYHTRRRKPTHVNLLLLQEESRTHYCYIKNLKALVNHKQLGYICDGCLCDFRDLSSLTQHQKQDCFRVKTVMAHETLRFVDKDQGVALPITVYADFEAMLENTSEINKKTNQDTYCRNVSKHTPYSFGFYIKCIIDSDDEFSCLKTYCGLDCHEKFLKMLKSSLEIILDNLDVEVKCIPIFFHNFSKYDAHFLVKGLDSIPGPTGATGSKYNFIAIYKTITIKNKEIKLQFLDSMKFLNGSLQNLVEKLDRDKFIESRQFWCDLDEELFELLTQKGVFPYEYIKTIDDLQKTSLPKKEYFYDRVKASHVSNEAYERALYVWKKFKCKTIWEYSKIYLQTDVLLLADLFENLRRICLRTYELDPAQYHSMSSLSWDAMLKITEVQLEPLPNVGMLAFLKRAMRGGVTHCTRRYATANNKYLSTYDENKTQSYLMYYDANNLYGWAMSQPLPYKDFQWVDVDTDFEVAPDSDVGYFLEVDLMYPDDKNIHDWHADYPFCPEKKIPEDVNDERLITDLTSKKNYVLHHSYLNVCIKNGLVLEKIHRILAFKQKPWLKPYIDYNIKRRAAATSSSEKDFYKQMNNSIFGKTIQNIENYVDIKILHHWFPRGGYSTIEKPEYHSHVINGDNTITVQLKKTKREYKTPVYVGLSVLDLSKSHMYKFHYSVMKKKFGKKLKLLYTDTDSLLYQIFTEDFYADIKGSLEVHFDTSEYTENNQFEYPQLNKMKVGYFKDEFKGSVLKEFVALRPKVYMIEADGANIKKAASAPNVITEKFTIEDYKNCLFNQEPLYKEIYAIKAVGHDIYTQHIRKAVLKPIADPKRHMLDLIDSLPFGHYSLKKEDLDVEK